MAKNKNTEHNLKVGDKVIIHGQETFLKKPFTKVRGGWIIDPPVGACSYWNEMQMTLPKQKPES